LDLIGLLLRSAFQPLLEVLLSYFGNKTGKYQAPFGTFLNQNMFTEKKLYLRQGRHVIFLHSAQVVLRGCVI